uniref:Uncharacterized protein n=1 Tax=Chlamydomonas leiostraca TaxID=1034604 RepID=A0A7S0RLF8_9CHLO|mmetsp:Transcript_25167/g.63866  ORF Transcript_25167/g.63866 Transcript_25167/m.63866 type:complete len:176 (+) Transcript_25167:191-718(+)|eukprot:CAMPEP_0202872754 /NCGR_PEP_ID=MMETSP1391-20130828/21939_1 /ASSEMBLY_ACC=CAM_ASM_000867 /TAXON_ID=1034604 /ORGANISM="Chlamydomonas leiostraca, Strain SAG 11-49" /LENGTH=175 /DNA_ID=CAMNT_0049553881 /DNA_START=84 /DNA_END=611 /DNA_ORIENTATION=+
MGDGKRDISNPCHASFQEALPDRPSAPCTWQHERVSADASSLNSAPGTGTQCTPDAATASSSEPPPHVAPCTIATDAARDAVSIALSQGQPQSPPQPYASVAHLHPQPQSQPVQDSVPHMSAHLNMHSDVPVLGSIVGAVNWVAALLQKKPAQQRRGGAQGTGGADWFAAFVHGT